MYRASFRLELVEVVRGSGEGNVLEYTQLFRAGDLNHGLLESFDCP
jgi:hypothetical protein